ncbi:PREDICTED: uncharacterized protein LOC104821274 [Tarenaya hassleriana]|uniref:uncharacterized protein LOC104821274 n=1 Tax=Tarenaya hassleriana TaxID=28532 RepID=UPI00053C18C8|nr:PREDICTED: uncharacterized protein LOC104821274 [Tarenaya hassleriana]
MACLEMYNSNGRAPMSPRISFSNDFVEIKPEKKNNTRTKTESHLMSTSSSDFEFSVANYTMMPADELFSKGKLLPFKETSHVQRTLREELLIEEEGSEEDDFTLRPPPSSSSSSKGKWKGLLGLKRNHVIGSKKTDKINEERFVHSETKQSQVEGSTCSGMEKGM